MSSKEKLVSPPEGGGTIIDEATFESLRAMFKSGDEANHNIGRLLLTQCNPKESVYWIWRLARETWASNLVNLRTKLGRKFRDDIDLFYIANTNETTFARWLMRKNWMTPEIWQRLKPQMIDQFKRQSHTEFFNVTIQIKDHIVEYDTDNQPISLK